MIAAHVIQRRRFNQGRGGWNPTQGCYNALCLGVISGGAVAVFQGCWRFFLLNSEDAPVFIMVGVTQMAPFAKRLSQRTQPPYSTYIAIGRRFFESGVSVWIVAIALPVFTAGLAPGSAVGVLDHYFSHGNTRAVEGAAGESRNLQTLRSTLTQIMPRLVITLGRGLALVMCVGIGLPLAMGYGRQQWHVLARYLVAIILIPAYRTATAIDVSLTTGVGSGAAEGWTRTLLQMAGWDTDSEAAELQVVLNNTSEGMRVAHAYRVHMWGPWGPVVNFLAPLMMYQGARLWSERGTTTMGTHALGCMVVELFLQYTCSTYALAQTYSKGSRPLLLGGVYVSLVLSLAVTFYIWYRSRQRHSSAVMGRRAHARGGGACSSGEGGGNSEELRVALEHNGVPTKGIPAVFLSPGRMETIIAAVSVGAFTVFVALSGAGITRPCKTLVPQLVFLLSTLAAYVLQRLWHQADAWAAQKASEGKYGNVAEMSGATVQMRVARNVGRGARLAKALLAGVGTVTVWSVWQMWGMADPSLIMLMLVPHLWLAAVLALALAVPAHPTDFCNPQHSAPSLAVLQRYIFVSGARFYPIVHAARALGTAALFPGNVLTADTMFMLQEPTTFMASFCVASAVVACIGVHCSVSQVELLCQLGVMGAVVFPLTAHISRDNGGVLHVAIVHVLLAAGALLWRRRLRAAKDEYLGVHGGGGMRDH